MMTGNWFAPCMGAVMLWGLWGFFLKLAALHTPRSTRPGGSLTLFAMYLGTSVVVSLAVFGAMRVLSVPVTVHPKGTLCAALAALFSVLGSLLMILALNRGSAAVVVALTALYPVVVLVLGRFLLGESMSGAQGAGFVLAIISIVLMSR